jgi:hypothetical protein
LAYPEKLCGVRHESQSFLRPKSPGFRLSLNTKARVHSLIFIKVEP